MKARRILSSPVLRSRSPALACIAGLALAACSPPATPTLFVAPTMAAVSPASLPAAPTADPSPAPLEYLPATPAEPTPTPPCTDDLAYLQDLTIPDGSAMLPGQLIDKRWQVTNSGTCNWDQRYAFKLVGGDAMGAVDSLPLYPARAGAQATLSILFTAPQAPGTYECQWQAVNPDGVAFGDTVYMQIVVSP